ncbi:MAG: hypothetical protein COA67_11135 [Lutibacter sp.]|nr:MAG: hypothetical protein COA67_11135 [Lutibacter sp.]
MKNQFLGTFFYMLYIVAMLQPIMPLIEYNLNKEYIVSVLCENRNKPELACNGKCYLEKRLKESKSQDSHNHSIPQIDLSKYPVSLLDFTTYNTKEFKIFDSEQLHVIEFTSQDFYTSLLKPPQSES